MDHRLHDGLHPLTDERPRNPFRNEADAFRLLAIVAAAGAIVVVVTLLTRPVVGAAVALVLVALGLWRIWRWAQAWRRTDARDGS